MFEKLPSYMVAAGLTWMPGESIGTMNMPMPACAGVALGVTTDGDTIGYYAEDDSTGARS